MPDRLRKSLLAALGDGRIEVLCNCMVLTEGWDLPALECAIIARPTASLALHLQIVGRIMRACPGKSGCIVLDHAGNHHVHGLVTRRLVYSLDSKVWAGAADPLGLRRCRQCGLFYDDGAFYCPECGWAPDPGDEPERPGIHGRGELAEFDDRAFEYRAAVWELIEAERSAMGHPEHWAVRRYRERFGETPLLAGGELVDPASATAAQKMMVYTRLCEHARTKGFRYGWASHRYKAIFGCWPRGFVRAVRGESISGG